MKFAQAIKQYHLPGENIMLRLLQYYDNIPGFHSRCLNRKKHAVFILSCFKRMTISQNSKITEAFIQGHIHNLVTLSPKGDLLSVLHSFVDWDFQDFSFLDCLLAFASVAAILLADHLA